LSAADRALADKAKSSGTAFQSRGEATKSFEQKYAKQYTAKYEAEPAARPTHIPSTYVYNNQNYSIVYDRTYRGYGYYSLGRWYPYDPLVDAVMLSALMNQHNYYSYPSGYSETRVVHTDGGSFLAVFFVIMGLVVVVIVIGAIASRKG
jgi:hypothetical protein